MWQGWRIRTRIFGGIRKIGCNLPNRDMDRRKGMEEKRGKVKGTVKGYIWEKQWARRRNKKGRSMVGMLMRVKRGKKVKGVMRKEGEEEWKIIGVYVNRDIEKK